MRCAITLALLLVGTTAQADPEAFREDLAAVRAAGTALYLINPARPNSCPEQALVPVAGGVYVPEGQETKRPGLALGWDVVDGWVYVTATGDGTYIATARYGVTRTGNSDGIYHLDAVALCRDANGAQVCTEIGPDEGADAILAMADPCSGKTSSDTGGPDQALDGMLADALAFKQPLHLGDGGAADIYPDVAVTDRDARQIVHLPPLPE